MALPQPAAAVGIQDRKKYIDFSLPPWIRLSAHKRLIIGLRHWQNRSNPVTQSHGS